MATIQEKFPGLPFSQVRSVPVALTFQANLAAGLFVFDQRLPFYNSDSNDVLVVDGLELSADIDQLNFSQSILAPFQVALYRGIQNSPVLQQPFNFAAFSQGHNFSCNFSPTNVSANGKDQIFMTLKGTLQQTPQLVALDSVKIFMSCMVYILKTGQIR